MTTKKPAKSKAGMLDGKGRVKNPKMPARQRPSDYAGVGAPSKYKPEYCAQVLEMGRKGFSRAQMAADFEVSLTTLQVWEEAHPEFFDALTRAKALAQAWWENVAMTNLVMPQGSGTFQAAVWAKSVAARFPHDYTDKNKTELTGKDGGAIEHSLKVEFVNP